MDEGDREKGRKQPHWWIRNKLVLNLESVVESSSKPRCLMEGLSWSSPADVGDLAALGAAFGAHGQGLCQAQSPRLLTQGCPPLCGAPPQLAESPALLVTSHYLMDRLQARFGLRKCHLCRMLLERQRWPAVGGVSPVSPVPPALSQSCFPTAEQLLAGPALLPS